VKGASHEKEAAGRQEGQGHDAAADGGQAGD
jgi:hypothetical protein